MKLADRVRNDARIIIVGAGHAGGTVAALLRTYGHTGPITMIGEEPVAPYQRPPLSKAWLKGDADAAGLALRQPGYYAEHHIAFRPSVRIVELDRGDRAVVTATGERLNYDILILATGARPIALPVPGCDLNGVLFLRTAADAEALKAAIGPGKHLVIIGGGYVGLEAAATARGLGADVVVVEREARLLARVACTVLSRFFQCWHEKHDVEVVLGASVTALHGIDGQVTAVDLSDGSRLPCDSVLIGIGAAANCEIGRDAGLTCASGIVVDLEARTSDPAIFAIGDVAYRPMPIYGCMVRLESVPNALEQAKQAACAITGRAPPTPEAPWFWSDQYNLKLQIAGIAHDADRTLVRGDPASGAFAVFHLKGDLIQAVEAINAVPEFMVGRQLILGRKPIVPQKLANSAISMKEVAA